ncbi:hypothetical protein LZ30DRAFT_684830 [Colletotrichum cereale]|nr:hypothetical protein LZ30DRAFT_684830 [Colletotrichum cereale]
MNPYCSHAPVHRRAEQRQGPLGGGDVRFRIDEMHNDQAANYRTLIVTVGLQHIVSKTTGSAVKCSRLPLSELLGGIDNFRKHSVQSRRAPASRAGWHKEHYHRRPVAHESNIVSHCITRARQKHFRVKDGGVGLSFPSVSFISWSATAAPLRRRPCPLHLSANSPSAREPSCACSVSGDSTACATVEEWFISWEQAPNVAVQLDGRDYGWGR